MPALIIAGGAALAQGIVGIAQYSKGVKDAKNLTRPEYHIPPEIEKNMTEADLMSYYGMPDAQKAEYQQNIQRTQQSAVRGIADRKGGLGTIVAAQQQTQDAYTKMLSMDVQQRMQNISRAQQMRATMAQYRDKAFQINEMDPYEQKYNEAQAMMGAGMQNIMGGLQTGASVGMTKMAVDGDVAAAAAGVPSLKNATMNHNSSFVDHTNSQFQAPPTARFDQNYGAQEFDFNTQGGMNSIWNQPTTMFNVNS